jgi:AcrR family transcriptional regulator
MPAPKTAATRRPKPKTARKQAAASYHHGDLPAALRGAAESILLARGAADVSLREVARAAGVSHAAPYRHFASREALLASLAAAGFERLKATLVACASRQPRERLIRLGEAYVGFAIAEPAMFRLMFGPELAKPAFPELKAAADQTLAVLRDALVALGASPPATGEAISAWALVHGLAELILDDRIEEHAGSEAPMLTVRRAVEIFADGLAARVTRDAGKSSKR